ncbi:MAG: hypothetical protein ACI376_02305 [Candidatus Bruticola sp.]
MKHIDEKIVKDELDRAVFLKAEHVRVFKDESVWAIELESGSVMSFTNLGKALYMACNGLDNGLEIGRRLGIEATTVRSLLSEMILAGFIKIAGSVRTVRDRAINIDENMQISAGLCIFDATDLEKQAYGSIREAAQIWYDRGHAFIKTFCHSDHNSREGGKPIFYFRNWDWSKHSRFLNDLISSWQQSVGLSDDKLPGMNKIKMPFYIVIESAYLPKVSNFIDGLRSSSSQELLCNWKRFSDLGRLWCRLHLWNTCILWIASLADLKQTGTSAFSEYFHNEPQPAPGLAAAAEISSMLLDTTMRNFSLSPGYCGSFPIAGISVMPIVRCSQEGELKAVAEVMSEANCCAWGFSLSESLLLDSPIWLDNELDELLQLCFDCEGLQKKNVEIFPLTRWIDDLLGFIKRSEGLEHALNKRKTEIWFKNKCRRCPNWHFCFSSLEHPPLPCSWLSRKVIQILRRVVGLPSNQQSN